MIYPLHFQAEFTCQGKIIKSINVYGKHNSMDVLCACESIQDNDTHPIISRDFFDAVQVQCLFIPKEIYQVPCG